MSTSNERVLPPSRRGTPSCVNLARDPRALPAAGGPESERSGYGISASLTFQPTDLTQSLQPIGTNTPRRHGMPPASGPP